MSKVEVKMNEETVQYYITNLENLCKKLQQENEQLKANRDKAIECVKNHIHQETYTGYMDAKELMKLVSLLGRGKE